MLRHALILVMFLCAPSISHGFQTKGYTYNLLRGSIKFPENIDRIPMIRVHCMGIKIPYTSCEKNYTTHEFAYNIPIPAHQRTFHILITEKIHYETIHFDNTTSHTNTIQYLKLPNQQPYKLYSCELTCQDNTLEWDIQELNINTKTRQIPDDTIIISYNPAYIQGLKAINTFSLPTIMIKHDILDICGSLEKFNEDSIRSTLASIDLDSFHKTIDQKIRHIGNRNIIAQA